MRSLLFSFGAIVLLAFASCSDSDSSSGLTAEDIALGEELRALADAYVEDSIDPDDPGLAYFVIGPRGVVAEGAYGLANIEQEIPITADTPFEVGSVAKQFTAMAVMMLVEAGSLALDDSIANELSESPTEWSGITVEQLLLHTSGIPNFTNVSGTVREGWSNEQVLEWAVSEPLLFEPGDRFEYTNTGYVLLALIVERAAGQPFETYVQERIFAPLGMSDSLVADVWPPDIADRAVSYIQDTVIEFEFGATGYAGQLATLEDMKRWEAELRDVTLVSTETLAEIYTAHVAAPTGPEGGFPSFADCGYGYGWDICDQEGLPPEVSHTGERISFHSWYRRFPEEEVAVLVLTNGSDATGNVFWGFPLADELAKTYFGASAPE